MTTDRLPVAVLWDMDGTLVDTEPLWTQARIDLAAEFGIEWVEGGVSEFAGKPMLETGRIMADRGIRLSPTEVVARLVEQVARATKESEPPWRPGARDLLAALAEAGIRCALVTQAYRAVAVQVAAAAHPSAFTVVIAGDDVTRSKPDPQPYRLAADALHVAPVSCVAIEDSDTGCRSALAAGCATLYIPHGTDVPDRPGQTRRESLVAVTVDDLRAITAAHRAERARHSG
ncbi:MAG: HAD family phosphatase [Micrococcales bacterium]|nr:HAD family phosphatase [Micrococcales bacterium]